MKYEELPALYLSQKELDELQEYSCSLPTGTTIGKRWKRDENSGIHGPAYRGLPEKWAIGEYAEHPTNPDLVKINWYQARIIGQSVRALVG